MTVRVLNISTQGDNVFSCKVVIEIIIPIADVLIKRVFRLFLSAL